MHRPKRQVCFYFCFKGGATAKVPTSQVAAIHSLEGQTTQNLAGGGAYQIFAVRVSQQSPEGGTLVQQSHKGGMLPRAEWAGSSRKKAQKEEPQAREDYSQA